MKNELKLFEDKKIRTVWDDLREEWYFSVVDIIAVLTESAVPRRYWSDLKRKLGAEGSELYEKIVQLKLPSADGKNYKTDAATTEQVLRLIQSIPSKKAEPFKIWLAKTGNERINEIADPELAIDRALETYLKKGYSPNWVNQQLKAIEVRKGLTDEWEKRGVKKGQEYAILTDEITKAWADITTREYKTLKGLKKENLRDNMTNAEIVLNMLAELTTTEIEQTENPQNLDEHKKVARKGGSVAKTARIDYEKKTGKKVVTSLNAKEPGKRKELR